MFSEQEIRSITSRCGNTITQSDDREWVIIQEVAAPVGWSKQETDVMLLKNFQQVQIFVDSDLELRARNQSPVVASADVIQGWREILFRNTVTTTMEAVDELTNTLKFQLKEVQSAPSVHEIVLPDEQVEVVAICDVNMIEKEGRIQIQYRYQGGSAIIAQEIWSLDGLRIRNLGVKEATAGIVTAEWNFVSDQGNVVGDGMYLVKLRVSSEHGEIYRTALIHKSSQR